MRARVRRAQRVAQHMFQQKNAFEDIASERKIDCPKCVVSWDRVGIIAPSRPHSRVGIIVVVWGTVYDKDP
jgi:hypothetical protein